MIYALLGIVGLIGAYLVAIYNSLVSSKNKVKSAWSDIDVQLKKRYNLVPQLVEIVKGYAKHEKDTLESVTKMRTAAMNASTPTEKAKNENMLAGALKTLFAVSENYPDLKANENFLQLQTELAKIEGSIEMARRYYNGTVKDYNTKIQVFPNVLIARNLGYTEEKYFELDDEKVRKVVDVKF